MAHFEVFQLTRSIRQFDFEKNWIQSKKYFMQPWCIESSTPELALYGSKNECTRTNTVLPQIFEISTGTDSLKVAR